LAAGNHTCLRSLNRMNDTIPTCHVEGEIKLDGEDIYSKSMNPVLLPASVGMVFQKPDPFPSYRDLFIATGSSRLSAHCLFSSRTLDRMGENGQIFTNPRHQLTENYITGKFGSS